MNWTTTEEKENYLLLYASNGIKGELGGFSYIYENSSVCDAIQSPRYQWTWQNYEKVVREGQTYSEETVEVYNAYATFN